MTIARDSLNRQRPELEGNADHFERQATIARAAVDASLEKADRFTAAIEAIEADNEFMPTDAELELRSARLIETTARTARGRR